MALVRMDLQTLVVGAQNTSSIMVLRPHNGRNREGMQLPIRIGYTEAAAIGMSQYHPMQSTRPKTHDLLKSVIEALDATLSSVSITEVHGSTFFAQLRLLKPTGEQVLVDSRPSDAVALALRAHAPIYAEDSVLETAGMPDFHAVEEEEKHEEMERFHDFVEHLSPDDFTTPSQGSAGAQSPGEDEGTPS